MMLINKHIGFDKKEGMGIDGKRFAQELFAIDALKPKLITFYTNSLGGCVENGFDIFNAVGECKSPTKSIIYGFAYSTAGWCTLNADDVEIKSYATGMMHMPAAITENPNPNDTVNQFVNVVSNSICKILSNKSGRGGIEKLSEDKVKQMMLAKTYMTGDQMVGYGLADRVINSGDVFNHVDTESDYTRFEQIFNKEILKKPTDMFFPKVLNRLGLSEGSDENEAIGAIARIENAAKAATQERDTLLEKLKAVNESQEELQARMTELQSTANVAATNLQTKEAEIAALNQKLVAVNTEKDQLASEKLAADNAAKAVADKLASDKANELVNEYVTLGKIENKDDTIAVWNRMAINDYEGTKAILETQKTSFTAPVPVPIEAAKVNNQAETPGTFDYFRAQNRLQDEEKRAKIASEQSLIVKM